MESSEMTEFTDYYSYDYWESINYFDWAELIPSLVVYILSFVLGLCGNSLIVFATYQYRKMQSVTNILLASLASADLLLIIFCIPVKLAKLFSFTWTMGLFLCKCVHYVQNVSTICSVLTLTAISIERYYAILHPMKAKYICTVSQARKVIAVTWVLSIILAMPILYVQNQSRVGLHRQGIWCTKNWDENKTFYRLHEIYMLLLVLVIPTCIMTFTYSTICWEVWRVMERRKIMTSKHALSRTHTIQVDNAERINLTNISKLKKPSKTYRDDIKTVKQVIYMLVAVVVLFAICWGPLLIDNLLSAYDVTHDIKIGKTKYMMIAFHLMAYLNSCINPIIYGFMSKNFRDSFQAALCCFTETLQGQRKANLVNNSIRQISRSGSQTRNTSVK